MSWHPNLLTLAQLEQRRLAAGRLLRAGRLTQADIAQSESEASGASFTRTARTSTRPAAGSGRQGARAPPLYTT
jgi:hypothetical protein